MRCFYAKKIEIELEGFCSDSSRSDPARSGIPFRCESRADNDGCIDRCEPDVPAFGTQIQQPDQGRNGRWEHPYRRCAGGVGCMKKIDKHFRIASKILKLLHEEKDVTITEVIGIIELVKVSILKTVEIDELDFDDEEGEVCA